MVAFRLVRALAVKTIMHMSIRVIRGNINETKLKWRCAMEC
jgi:hypothetical protein